jgi:hypothetical protein
VCQTAGATQGGEPFIKTFTIASNRALCTAVTPNPWTLALDQAAHLSAAITHANVWAPLGIANYWATNPYEIIGHTGGNQVSTSATLSLIPQWSRQMAQFGLICNNSLIGWDPSSPPPPYINLRGNTYTQLYNGIPSPSQLGITGYAFAAGGTIPIGFQSATETKIESSDPAHPNSSNIEAVTTMIQAWGGTCLELPQGCDTTSTPGYKFTSPQATTFNTWASAYVAAHYL